MVLLMAALFGVEMRGRMRERVQKDKQRCKRPLIANSSVDFCICHGGLHRISCQE